MVDVTPAHLVGTGGALGALCRYAVTSRIESDEFPVGTLTVNCLGGFLLGLVVFLGAGTDILLLVGTGAAGSFTTFSTFSFETVRLWESGAPRRAALNAALNFLGTTAAIGVAWLVAFGFS